MTSKKLLLCILWVLGVMMIAASSVTGHTVLAGRDDLGPLPFSQTPVPVAVSTSSAVGPDEFPQGINPLTGLAVQDPAMLGLPPALVSVTNFPVSARPQAGLSFSPYVFEMYIGRGMTRYLALFYGDYPTAVSGGSTGVDAEKSGIGPVRSGRLPYEKIRKHFSAVLVTSGASAEVGAQLNESATVYGSEKDNINSALIDPARLQRIAEASVRKLLDPANLTGNLFEPAVPAGGNEAQKAWIFYNYLNQIEWIYNPDSGAYLRFQDRADGSGKFYPATDRLTGEQLAFENIVVLFAEHIAHQPAVIDIDLMYTTRPALLFRDGQVYRIYWTTIGGEYEKQSGKLRPIRFVDAKGNPFPMKPGQTWVEIVTSNTTVQEMSQGGWKVRFYAP